MQSICPSQCGEQRNTDTAMILLNGIKLPTEYSRIELQQSIVGVDPGMWFGWEPAPKQAQKLMSLPVPKNALQLLQDLNLEASAWERAVNYIVERDPNMKFGQQSASKLILCWSRWMSCMQARMLTLMKWWEGHIETPMPDKTCDITKELQEIEVWPDETENNVSMWVGRCCCATALDIIMNTPILALSRTIFYLKSEMGLPKMDARWESALHECTLGQPMRFANCQTARPRYEQEGVMMYTLSATKYAQEAAEMDVSALYEKLMGKPMQSTEPVSESKDEIETEVMSLKVMNQFMNECLSVVALSNKQIPLSLAMLCVWCCPALHMALLIGLLKPLFSSP